MDDSGSRSIFTSRTNLSGSNVKAAPRRAAASTGSGIAASCARVKWYPSMGTLAEMGIWSGDSRACSAFIRWAIVTTREVLPEPGVPPTAIMRRLVGGVERYFSREIKGHISASSRIYILGKE